MTDGRKHEDTHLKDDLQQTVTGVMHSTNLFDETPGTDEATGRAWDTTGGIGNDESLTEITETHINRDTTRGDAADTWLRENDPNYGK